MSICTKGAKGPLVEVRQDKDLAGSVNLPHRVE